MYFLRAKTCEKLQKEPKVPNSLNWKVIADYANSKSPFVLITVGNVKGSSPRETGAKILVNHEHVIGTIGGGNLEFFAIARAKDMLTHANDNEISEHKTPLTPNYDQCCGGLVQLIFEKINPQTSTWLPALFENISKDQTAWLVTDTIQKKRFIKTQLKIENSLTLNKASWTNKQNQLIEPLQSDELSIVIFGAGHVGKAIVNQLQYLNTNITVVDSRPEHIPNSSPKNVEFIETNNWKSLLKTISKESYFLVVTHSHKLDYEITEEVLKQGEYRYLGLIGSKTKKVRFQRKLLANGITQSQLNTLTCPIGLPSIQGKTPEVIAASVVAQILEIDTQTIQSHLMLPPTKRIQHV